MSSAMARAFHGSPTQKPSILPTFMLATICGGGTVMSETVLVGIDAAGAEIVAHPHGVRAGRKRHGEGQRRARRLCLIDKGLQRLGIVRDLSLEFVCKRDGLAVAVEQPRNDHRLFRRAGRPIVEAIGMPMSMCVA